MIDILTHRRSARHMLAAFQRKQEEQAGRARAVVREHFNDGARVLMRDSKPRTAFSSLRMGDKSRGFGRREIRMGPNEVHAFITRADGSVEDLGVSLNLLTNIGRDVLHGAIGGFIPAGGAGSPATAVTSTGLTATGTPWTASNLATPQLGLAGFRVYASVTGVGTSPVYANIIANTTSVLLLDQWWTATDGLGTTPANTNGFIIGAGGVASIRFMGLTTDAAAASAADTVLASEITNNGANRALATYAHTMGAATDTLQKAYSITGTLTSVVKMGLFCSLPQGGTTAALGGPCVLETVLNQSATVGNGDTLTCVKKDTKTLTRHGVHEIQDLKGKRIEVLNRFGQWEAATVKSFGVQRLHRIEFAHLNPVYATADHRWWQRDGRRVKTVDLKQVPFTEDEKAHAEVTAVVDTGLSEEVFCCVVPGSESFTLANGLVTGNCTDTVTISG